MIIIQAIPASNISKNVKRWGGEGGVRCVCVSERIVCVSCGACTHVCVCARVEVKYVSIIRNTKSNCGMEAKREVGGGTNPKACLVLVLVLGLRPLLLPYAPEMLSWGREGTQWKW